MFILLYAVLVNTSFLFGTIRRTAVIFTPAVLVLHFFRKEYRVVREDGGLERACARFLFFISIIIIIIILLVIVDVLLLCCLDCSGKVRCWREFVTCVSYYVCMWTCEEERRFRHVDSVQYGVDGTYGIYGRAKVKARMCGDVDGGCKGPCQKIAHRS